MSVAAAGSNAEVAQEKFGPFARADAPKEAPANPAELLVIQGDGLRVRERVHAADTSAADAADRPSEASDELPEADRAKGWPIASGHVEAFAKHVGGRMKAASKRWKPVEGSEAMVTLLADQASQDGRCQRRWPADPVPLEKLGTT